MTTKEMIEVMQAYERGEQIEFMSKDLRSSAVWTTMTQEPEWNWTEFDYRVKPAYRPYKNAAEFFAAQKEHGMNIRLNSCNYCRMPLYITDTLIGVQCSQSDDSVISINISYEDLLQGYTWQDGTHCGVKEE